jgi:hypothetical protein
MEGSKGMMYEGSASGSKTIEEKTMMWYLNNVQSLSRL